MSKYNQFIFESYTWDEKQKTLALHYSLDTQLTFTESYRFNFDFAPHDPETLDRALQSLFFMAGVSYYKTYTPAEIVIQQGSMTPEQASFFSKTYQRGLGEFWYTNHLDPHTPVNFPAANHYAQPLLSGSVGEGSLVAIGGGKDSLVTTEILRNKEKNLTTWSLNHRSQLTGLVKKIGLNHCWVERQWDTQLLELNKQDAMNGHIPISAIFACVGTVVAILAGKRSVVMSNEQSANEPTLRYQGVAINHQYSKSQEFEQDYQKYLFQTLGDRVQYYSFLRPLSEVHISKLFARLGFQTYKGVFSSCNRAFVHTSDSMSWCGACSKCAFIFLAFTPFIERHTLEKLWGGKNLLLEPTLEPTYRKLLGIEGDKPLDCVGDIKESRSAMRLAFEQYSELAKKYIFEIPAGYTYTTLFSHEMPSAVYQYLRDEVNR